MSHTHTADLTSPAENTFSQEYSENGIYFSKISHAGNNYRLGATIPTFRQELTSLPTTLSAEDFLALQQKGLWLAPDTPAPNIAITCGGVGSVWPGLGRCLYDTFPAARAAMDEIASHAQWDILALMDEKDMEKLSRSRWQLPYLFFIEFAQARYLESLGFTPHIMSGHSLGEIISLCLAGVFDAATAWQVFDRRAVYIDGLEEEADRTMGMMAVYGNLETVQNILTIFPDLYICNQNTPTQYILGGLKEQLTEAKRMLRKSKCPAIVLPINMAFHHPHLHVLRQSAIDGLMGLTIHEPKFPIISNVTADVYPTDKTGICEYIADLDENTVRWVDCVHTMWQSYNIRHFLELGSADNVSCLTREIKPEAVCIAVNQKNNEVASMRSAVAALYALGHIPVQKLHSVPVDLQKQDSPATSTASHTAPSAKTYTQAPIPSHVADILPILAEAADIAIERLHPHQDLRHDLAIRSNRFPAMLYAFEKNFGIHIQFEDVMNVSTILDLANVVRNLQHKGQDIENTSEHVQSIDTPHKTISMPLLKSCFGHIPPYLQGYAPGAADEDIPPPALVVGSYPEELSPAADLHLAPTATVAFDTIQQKALASLVFCLPPKARIRPWLYPTLCQDLTRISSAFLQGEKAYSSKKNIYWQCEECFSTPVNTQDFTQAEQKSALPTSSIIHTLYQSTQPAFATWQCAGFDHFSLENTDEENTAHMLGVTREGRVDIHAFAKPTTDKSLPKELHCHTHFSLRGLTANGRRTETYRPYAQAKLLLSQGSPLAISLPAWYNEHDTFQKKIQQEQLKAFAKTHGLWHSPCGDFTEYSAYFAACIACLQKSVFDALPDDATYTLKNINHIRHLCETPQEPVVQFTWRVTVDENSCQLNGCLTNDSGLVLMTVENMFFIKTPR